MKPVLVHSDPLVAASSLLPSNLGRSAMVHALIKAYGLHDHLIIAPAKQATSDHLQLFHSSDYVDFLLEKEKEEELCEQYGLTGDCPVFDGLDRHVLMVAGSTLSAVEFLLNGHRMALNWDGGRHHAKKDEASGFCYINDIVLGITALHRKFSRVLYLDLDIHHGDGVQQAFYCSSKVYTVSFHRHDPGFFPGSGSKEDTGAGKGAFHNLNVPLKPGLTDDALRHLYTAILPPLIQAYQPEVIVMQCGCDGMAMDPLVRRSQGSNEGWNLSSRVLADLVSYTMQTFALPMLLLGGGGYNSISAAKCWTNITAKVAGIELNDVIPEHEFDEMYVNEDTLDTPLSHMDEQNDVESLQEILSFSLNMIQRIPQ